MIERWMHRRAARGNSSAIPGRVSRRAIRHRLALLDGVGRAHFDEGQGESCRSGDIEEEGDVPVWRVRSLVGAVLVQVETHGPTACRVEADRPDIVRTR